MAKFKVLMADSIFINQDIEKEILKEIDAELVLSPRKDEATLAELAKDCDAIITSYAEISKHIIDSCEQCKVIIRTGIGYNNIDVEAATAKQIMVANVLNYCVEEVADHAMALILACLRKVVFFNQCVHNGTWDVNLGRPISRVSTLTLGLFGFGNIARQLAKRAKGFDLNIIAYDPFLPDEVFEKNGVTRFTDQDEFIKACDILSLHLQLNKSTQGMIDKNAFQIMKPSSYLINVSRGGLVNEFDLLDAIKNHKIAGCALDVMETEPGDLHSSLMTYDNVIVTPHAAFYSDGSDVELRQKTAEQIVQTFTQGYPEFWLNKK
ncbi:MAG: C-terminal binding protein [Lachnospiraceae bacterium]|nr:C-terminal binding protein [Lachnospiraceae bacterium]